jgi:hypothetical protein
MTGHQEVRTAPQLAFMLAGADYVECRARLRELRALALLLCGRSHPVTAALESAIANPNAIDQALHLLGSLPALRRRQLLAAYAALMARGGR